MKNIWTGYLKVNYLAVPVKVYNSTSAKTIRFRMLHSVCRTRINQENCSEEIVDVHEIDGAEDLVAVTAEPHALSLAKLLVERLNMGFIPEQYRDDYSESLHRLIRAKIKGKKFAVEQHAGPEKIASLMDAVERSLKQAPQNMPVKGAK